MAATSRPASAPTPAPSRTRLDSRARTRARSERGTSRPRTPRQADCMLLEKSDMKRRFAGDQRFLRHAGQARTYLFVQVRRALRERFHGLVVLGGPPVQPPRGGRLWAAHDEQLPPAA